MASKSDYLEVAILDHVLRNTALTSPVTVYCALCTVDPVDSDTGATITEVPHTNGYVRVAVTFGAAAAGAIANSAAVTWPAASGGNWGTITSFAILDSITDAAGNVLYWGTLTVDKAINDGDTAEFAIGDIDITED